MLHTMHGSTKGKGSKSRTKRYTILNNNNYEKKQNRLWPALSNQNMKHNIVRLSKSETKEDNEMTR
jgi:hypothetical protein